MAPKKNTVTNGEAATCGLSSQQEGVDVRLPHRAGLTVQGTLECWFPLLHLRVTESYNLVGGPSMAGPVPPTSERLSGSAKFTHLEAS